MISKCVLRAWTRLFHLAVRYKTSYQLHITLLQNLTGYNFNIQVPVTYQSIIQTFSKVDFSKLLLLKFKSALTKFCISIYCTQIK